MGKLVKCTNGSLTTLFPNQDVHKGPTARGHEVTGDQVASQRREIRRRRLEKYDGGLLGMLVLYNDPKSQSHPVATRKLL